MRDERDDGDPALVELLRREIERAGPLPFDRFMELALYHPRHGYYSSGPGRLGPRGDFFTASDAGSGFGRSIARQLAEIDERDGPHDPFHVVEFGAGRGLLARDVIAAAAAAHPGLAARLRYVAVDRSAAMREACRRAAPGAIVRAPDELEGPYRGCVLAVELFDALPVHRVRRRGTELVEVRVDADASGRLVEREVQAGAEVAAWAARYGAAAEEGAESEVCLEAASRLDALAGALERGVIIVVDYGHPAAELYARERRRGTLLAYHGHRASEDYLVRVGRQDLTAHVNFSALGDRAAELGLDLLALTTQDRFLVANGLLDEFVQDDLAASRDPRRVKRRLQAMQLIHPEGMGRRFRVMLLSKGISPPPTLAGAGDPFSRS